jgi:cytochrome c-type biogenesis protein CcsB
MEYSILFSWATFIYFASFIFYLGRTITGRDFWGRLATGAAWAGLAVQLTAFLLRWKASYDLGIGHIPLANLYESMVFFAGAIVFLYLILERRNLQKTIGTFVMPVAFLAMAYASIAPGMNSAIQPLIPALQSNWLTTHVVSCFLSYAGFAIAFGCGLIFFVKKIAGGDTPPPDGWAKRLPSFDNLDNLIYQSTVLGFVLLTVGIMTGSVWAHYAWGSYWSWDPKETWSLITWLIYAIMLHARLVRGWQGQRMAFLTIIGFASVLFTYLGVNYLRGLHSYLNG